ncbi:hypothetical protein SELR_pSRC102240 (plasmid) [Selenomonas ruminantium subsp. lactilytica TAM6421]|uniref:Autotransporter domain-containing protein n=1 Tax=Selenomonas ruminantium subsp. lactilytica (strain NBRC 103574 / TAM6421) TaxID=927704 RepID=I0GW94_SELRL|nr:autotransporter domain-containing protein [Selenomonas ruminantium]BAL85031.1 hypothetical protein SELR_pSRC102240 [Selenomonas ruminantium subsp. lactilytica TAM6421]
MHRSLGVLGLDAAAQYHSQLAEIGGEYKYDLHASDGKIWHISPYAGLQLSCLQQNGYAETGADPELSFRYEGNNGRATRIRPILSAPCQGKRNLPKAGS